MKHKQKIIIGTLFLAILFLISITSVSAITGANITIVNPVVATTFSGATVALNATIDADNTAGYTVASWYVGSSLSANTTWTFLKNVTNTSNVLWTSTFNSSIIEDASDYAFNVTIWNSTGKISKATASTIRINNTVPVAPTISDPTSGTSITSGTTQTYTSSVTDSKTTACTYIISRGGATSGDDYITGTASYSTSTCSFTKAFSSSSDNGQWYATITASDGLDSTTSSVVQINVEIPATGGGGGGYYVSTTPTPQDTTGTIQETTTQENTTSDSAFGKPVVIIISVIAGLAIIGLIVWAMKN